MAVLVKVLRLPSRESDPYDAPYANAAVLHRAGVRFAIVSDDPEMSRNLPYEAAMAPAYGLPGRGAARDHALAGRDLRRLGARRLDRARPGGQPGARERRHPRHPHAGDARVRGRGRPVARDAPHEALRALQGPAVSGAGAGRLRAAAGSSRRPSRSRSPRRSRRPSTTRRTSRPRNSARAGRGDRPDRRRTVAVVQGAPLASGFGVPRQSNSIYYLSGIETLAPTSCSTRAKGACSICRRETSASSAPKARCSRPRTRTSSSGYRCGRRAVARGDDRNLALRRGTPRRHLRGVRAGRGLRPEPV